MWILIAMIAIMPFEANPYLYLGTSFLGVFPDFTLIKLLGLIGLGWSVVQIMSGRAQVRILESKQAKAFVLYLLLVTFAILASGTALATLTRLLSIVFFLPIVLAAIRTHENLKTVLMATAGILIIVFPYAYRQLIRFGGRLGVGLYEPNYFALALVVVLPLAFVFARHQTVAWKRWFWVLGVGVLFLQIMLTASRGAFIGLLFVMALTAVRLAKQRVFAVSAMVSLLLMLLYVVPTSMSYRVLASGLDDEVHDSGIAYSNKHRLNLVHAGTKMMLNNPLTGVGFGQFKANVMSYGDLDAPGIAHNTYIELGAEMGLGSLLAFLVVLYTTLTSLRRSERLALTRGDILFKELAIGLQIGITGYMVSAIFLSAQFEKFFWLVMFLSISFERIVKELAERQAQGANYRKSNED